MVSKEQIENTSKRNEIIQEIDESVNEKDESDIRNRFSNLIRNGLNEKQFWDWVKGWIDADEVCKRAENWSIETQKEELRYLLISLEMERKGL